jgi:hypothetical protein
MHLRVWLAPLALTVSLFGNVTAQAADADALFAQGKFAEALAAYQRFT